MTPISLASINPGPPLNECSDDPAANDLCQYDGVGYSPMKLSSHSSKKAKLDHKQNPGKKPDGNAETPNYRRVFVGEDEDKPYYVTFTADLPGHPGQTIIAQLRQYDILPKNQNPIFKPIRVAIGQEVKRLGNNPTVVPLSGPGVVATNDSYVFEVTVRQDNAYDVTYQVVTSEDRSNN